MSDEGEEQKPNVGAGPEHLNLQVKSQVETLSSLAQLTAGKGWMKGSADRWHGFEEQQRVIVTFRMGMWFTSKPRSPRPLGN